MVTWDGVEEEGCCTCTQYMVHHHTRDMAKPRMELAPHLSPPWPVAGIGNREAGKILFMC